VKRVFIVVALRVLIVLALVVAGYGVNLQMRPPAPQTVHEPAETADTPIVRGRAVYGRYGCPACHGDVGVGGFANLNSETDGKVPGVTFVAEGYLKSELRTYLLKGNPSIGKKDPNGPRPPYSMPGWAGQMTDAEVGDLAEYLFSLMPKSKGGN
jgi:mono/diheme cytochrome c family protein